MRSLLDDPTYNPAFIRWENKEKGVFRIVPGQSKNIAKLWGIKKNNPTMTFDKLSRSLRYKIFIIDLYLFYKLNKKRVGFKSCFCSGGAENTASFQKFRATKDFQKNSASGSEIEPWIGMEIEEVWICFAFQQDCYFIVFKVLNNRLKRFLFFSIYFNKERNND